MMIGQTPPQESTVWQRLFEHLQTLDFISALFTWLFLLGNRLAEPLMSISAIYVIVSAGIPKWHIPLVYDFAIAVMIAAPEIILPGAFILAGQEQQRGNDKAWLLQVTCGLFVLLTMTTLADLFYFHLSGSGLNILMWARCATGVGYSILIRVLHPHQQQETTKVMRVADVSARLDAFAALLERIEQATTVVFQRMEQQGETVAQQHTQTLTESLTYFTETQRQLATFSERVALLETGLQEYLDETLAERLAPLMATLQNHDAVLALLPTLTEQVDKTPRLVTEEVTKVVKVTLEQHSQRTRTTHAAERSPVATPHRQAAPKTYGHSGTVHQEDGQVGTHPAKHPTPSASGESGDSERKRFVVACLEANSSLTIRAIQEQAMSMGLRISVGAISEYRKQFFQQ